MKILSLVCVLAALMLSPIILADEWKNDGIWHDGLVEKAVYSASRVVYGHPRPYTAIFFTNKEQHDKKTLTKASESKDMIEVWKHNQIEDIPTPNYTYHYVTTSHLAVDSLRLARLDCSSQEFCGTGFKQYLDEGGKGLTYWSFSYMPEAGRQTDVIHVTGGYAIAQDSLPLYLRDYNFKDRPRIKIAMLPSQKSNRPTPSQPILCEIRGAGEENNLHRIDIVGTDEKVIGTYWMAKDRLHVMLKYRGGPDDQQYDLKDLRRVNYWTIK